MSGRKFAPIVCRVSILVVVILECFLKQNGSLNLAYEYDYYPYIYELPYGGYAGPLMYFWRHLADWLGCQMNTIKFLRMRKMNYISTPRFLEVFFSQPHLHPGRRV